MARTKLRACLRGRNRRLIVACAFGARAVSVVAQDARRTAVGCSMSRWLLSRRMRDLRWVGADVAMVDVAQDARRTVVGGSMSRWLMSRKMRDVRWWDVRCRDGRCRAECATYGGGVFDVAMVDVAQNARRTVVGCSMSRWLMSRRMRDVRWWGPMSRWLMSRRMRDVRWWGPMSRWLLSRRMRDLRWWGPMSR